MDVLSISCELQMFCPFPCGKYIHRNLPEVWGWVQLYGKATYTSFNMKYKTLVPTVDPSGLQGSQGSSLLWSVTWMKVLYWMC